MITRTMTINSSGSQGLQGAYTQHRAGGDAQDRVKAAIHAKPANEILYSQSVSGQHFQAPNVLSVSKKKAELMRSDDQGSTQHRMALFQGAVTGVQVVGRYVYADPVASVCSLFDADHTQYAWDEAMAGLERIDPLILAELLPMELSELEKDDFLMALASGLRP